MEQPLHARGHTLYGCALTLPNSALIHLMGGSGAGPAVILTPYRDCWLKR